VALVAPTPATLHHCRSSNGGGIGPAGRDSAAPEDRADDRDELPLP